MSGRDLPVAGIAALLLLGACGAPRSRVSIESLTAEGSAYLNDGWCMTGIAAKLLHAEGAYRSPDKEGGALYMILTDIRWASADAAPKEGD